MLGVRFTDYFQVYSLEEINYGTPMLTFSGVYKDTPGRYSLQVINDHLHPHNDNEEELKKLIWPYLNHSCQPNAFVKTQTKQLIALRNIQADEEITIDYELTESKMSDPFNCFCGSEICRNYISGYAL